MAAIIMCSFNNINGIPRQKWLYDSLEDAVAQTLKVGMDLDCGWGGIHYYQTYGESAVQQGKVRETNIDNALMNIYTVLMRLGFFDVHSHPHAGVGSFATLNYTWEFHQKITLGVVAEQKKRSYKGQAETLGLV
ncbi:hypothetical protein J5N97_003947 [Dioscorea zingiberensis]|uniref:Uncharacterized protein n=1 Tax=Dioscorea zingiberensis TaxID=325984 RepID=A0A9D5HR55_9LILI|nr:hypothetical protein J5N97_003947 [Dioscorea zingiberensis]